jgi:aldose 1-epimerase
MSSASPERSPIGRLSDGRDVERWTLTTGDIAVDVLSFGGIVQRLVVPDREGRPGNVVLGFDEVEPYETVSPYFGALIGRYANRIARARFTLDGHEYRLPVNNLQNCLHGGSPGFDRRLWSVREVDAASSGGVAVRLDLHSPDGENGFSAALDVEVTYTLTPAAELRIDYLARNVEPAGGRSTVVNLTQHAYFNLAGEGAGSIEDHLLQLNASRYTPITDQLVPTGELAPVDGTPFDFRTPTRIGERIREAHPQLMFAQGYDHNLVLDGDQPADAPAGLSRAAVVTDPGSGRVLEVWTDQPGVQLYSGNFLDATLVGPSGRAYRQGDGFCLETQHFPDSPNQPDFPSTVLGPQETFRTSTLWRFGTA